MGSLIEGQASDTPLWPHGEQMVADAMRGRDPNAVAEEGDGSLAALPLLATLAHPPSGRALRVFSSEPVVQTCVAAAAATCPPAPLPACPALYSTVDLCLLARSFSATLRWNSRRHSFIVSRRYFATHLDGTEAGKGGAPLLQHGGLCLETQRPANAESVGDAEGYGHRIVRPVRGDSSTCLALP